MGYRTLSKPSPLKKKKDFQTCTETHNVQVLKKIPINNNNCHSLEYNIISNIFIIFKFAFRGTGKISKTFKPQNV